MAVFWIAVILVYFVAQLVRKTGNANQTGNESISVSCQEVCCHKEYEEQLKEISLFQINLWMKKIVELIKKFHLRENEKMIDIINA